MKNRIEKDYIGPIKVSQKHLWGAQTQRSIEYFNISVEKMPLEVVYSLVLIKKAAAITNYKLGLLSKEHKLVILKSASEILNGLHDKEFQLSVWQTGSGTHTNMNVNEVMANIANKFIADNKKMHPNDDINKNQSTNDVFASAMNIASLKLILHQLIPNIKTLIKVMQKKSKMFSKIIKVGRTHLQDAMPITLGQEMSGWISMLKHNLSHIKNSIEHLLELPLGGGAVGTGMSIHHKYAETIIEEVKYLTKLPFVLSANKFEALSSCDSIVQSHGTLKGLAASLMKIANDIRWLSSGPRCGINEIFLPENEPGSSMMPGKINPTQCESLTMICCQVMGNDVSINIGGSSGNFELNVFKPMIINNFLQSIRLLSDGIKNFCKYCVDGIKPNLRQINKYIRSSVMLVTTLVPHIGYDKSAEIARYAYKNNITLKKAAMKFDYITEKEFDNLTSLKEMIGIDDKHK